MKKSHLVLAILAVVVLVGVVIIGSNGRSSQTADVQTGGTSRAAEIGQVPVEAVTINHRTITRHVTYHGVLRPRTTVQLALQVGGRVREIPVQVGQSVQAGDALLRLDTSDLDIQVRQARAGLALATASLERLLGGATAEELAQVRAAVAQAEVQFNNANAEFERTERLFQSGSVSRQNLDSARSTRQIAQTQLDSARAQLAQVERGASAPDIAAAEAQVRQAEASLDMALLQLTHATLAAPVDGIVSRRGVEIGEMASPGNPVVTLVDLSELTVAVRASARDIMHISTGDIAAITIEDDASRTIQGVVHRIDPVAEAQSNLFHVEIRVPNPNQALRAGYFASVRILTAAAEGVLAVPERAIVHRDGRDGVFVVENGSAVFTPVEFGLSDGAWREVTGSEGLVPGHMVVTTGKEYLEHETPVRVRAQGGVAP